MQIPPSYKSLRRWVFQKEIKERKGRGTDQVGATRCGLPFLHAYEKRQCKNTLMNVAPGTETRHGGTTASNARQCYRTQSLRGRRRTHLRCRKHLPLSALRDSAPRFHTGSLLAPGPRLQIPRPAGARHVWTAALAPFYDSPKTLLSFLEADPAAAVHVLIAGRFSTFLTCDTAARRCAHCIDAGPSCNGRLGGRLAVLSACPPVRLACKSKTCLRVYSERRGHVCVPFRYKPAKTAGRCYCLCFTWTCVPRPWNPKARVGRHEFPRGLGRYFIFPR